jgi:uncharacterized protein YegJ (DUF2314 family)
VLWLVILVSLVGLGLGYFFLIKPKVPMFFVDQFDPEMVAIISEARESLPIFWERIRAEDPNEHTFALKVRIEDKQGVEHFWVINPSLASDRILGEINNPPTIVKCVKEGELISRPIEDVTDWSFVRGEKIVGNFTLREMIRRGDKSVQIYKEMLE